MFCQECGANLFPDTKFCSMCGHALAAEGGGVSNQPQTTTASSSVKKTGVSFWAKRFGISFAAFFLYVFVFEAIGNATSRRGLSDVGMSAALAATALTATALTATALTFYFYPKIAQRLGI